MTDTKTLAAKCEHSSAHKAEHKRLETLLAKCKNRWERAAVIRLMEKNAARAAKVWCQRQGFSPLSVPSTKEEAIAVLKPNETQVPYLLRGMLAGGGMYNGPMKHSHEWIPLEAGYCIDAPDLIPSGSCVQGKPEPTVGGFMRS